MKPLDQETNNEIFKKRASIALVAICTRASLDEHPTADKQPYVILTDTNVRRQNLLLSATTILKTKKHAVHNPSNEGFYCNGRKYIFDLFDNKDTIITEFPGSVVQVVSGYDERRGV